MAAVPLGGTVECHQVGDVTVGERRELVYVEDDDKNAALVERKTVVAQVPLEDGRTAVLTGVEYTAVAAPNDQQRNHTEPDSTTQRNGLVPDNNTVTPPQHRAPPSNQTHTVRAPPHSLSPGTPVYAVNVNSTARHTRPHSHRSAHRTTYRSPGPTTTLLVKVPSPWEKCQHYFYILWLLLVMCLGIAGLSYLGIGVVARHCDNKESEIPLIEMWLSSFLCGTVLVAFSLCVCLSCIVHCACCSKKHNHLCIGVVTGCGVVAAFMFIIAFSFNASAVGTVVDSPLFNSTQLHNSDCFSPYWLAYIPAFASGTVLLAFLFSVCCCVCCNICFRVCRKNNPSYRRL